MLFSGDLALSVGVEPSSTITDISHFITWAEQLSCGFDLLDERDYAVPDPAAAA